MAGKKKGQEDQFEGIQDETGEGFTFDMSEQEEDSGFPVAPAGTYELTVDACEYKISQSSGNPMWALVFLITGPEGDIVEKKIQVRNYQVFKPEQMGRVKGFLNKLGHSDLANAKDFNPKQIADDGTLVGSTIRARLGIRKSEEYGDQNEIKAFLSSGSEAGAGGGGFSM